MVIASLATFTHRFDPIHSRREDPVTTPHAENEQNLTAFDPLLQGLYDEASSRRQTQFANHFENNKRKKARYFFRLRIRNNWIEITIVSVSVIFILLSVALFIQSWPWTDPSGLINESPVVLACATILTLGVVILSSLSDPLQKAADVGPGFTMALLRRPGPWIVGVMVAPLTVFMAWLATKHPDAAAAQASALLVAGVYSLFWALYRNVIELSDSFKLGIVLAKHAHKNTKGMAKSAERLCNFTLRENTPQALKDEFTAIERASLVGGSIRNIVSAARRCLVIGKPFEAYSLWNAAVEDFFDLAKTNSGAIGQAGGGGDVIKDSLIHIARGLQAQGDPNAAALVIRGTAKLISLPYEHPDSAYVRMSINGALRLLLSEEWNDQQSILPTVTVAALGEQVSALVRIRAFDESVYLTQSLFQIMSKSCTDGMLHIEDETSIVLISAFITFLQIEEPRVRSYLLGNWARNGSANASISISKQGRMLLDPGSRFLPGFSLQGNDLQGVIIRIGKEDQFESASSAVESFLNRMLPRLPHTEELDLQTCALPTNVLALQLTLLYQRKHIGLSSSAGSHNGAWFISWINDWFLRIPEGTRKLLLRNDDFVDLFWSCLLAAGAADNSAQIVIQASLIVATWFDLNEEVADPFVLRFVEGILLASGQTINEVDVIIRKLTPNDIFLLTEQGMHLDPIGKINRCNRNRTKHFPEVPEEIERWVLENFPIFLEE